MFSFVACKEHYSGEIREGVLPMRALFPADNLYSKCSWDIPRSQTPMMIWPLQRFGTEASVDDHTW